MVTARVMEASRAADCFTRTALPPRRPPQTLTWLKTPFHRFATLTRSQTFYESTRRHRDHHATRDCQDRFPAHAF